MHSTLFFLMKSFNAFFYSGFDETVHRFAIIGGGFLEFGIIIHLQIERDALYMTFSIFCVGASLCIGSWHDSKSFSKSLLSIIAFICMACYGLLYTYTDDIIHVHDIYI